MARDQTFQKRKASEVDFDLPDAHTSHSRPILLKKRGASLLGQQPPFIPNGQIIQDQPVISESKDDLDIQPTSNLPPRNGLENSTGLTSFTQSLTAFLSTYIHLFGPSYTSELQQIATAVTIATSSAPASSASSYSVLLSTGHKLIEILTRFLSDLQSLALQQVQLRVSLQGVGVAKEVLEGIDEVLRRLDGQIIGMGREREGLVGELEEVEREFRAGGV